MKSVLKYPYGVSDFSKLTRKEYYFIDRTKFIQELEGLGESNLFFFRPRRFGKSLFISMLQFYYGIKHKEAFQEIFGQLYIGQNKTASANKYLMLRFDFSGIDTATRETTFNNFLIKVKAGIIGMMGRHSTFFNKDDRTQIESQKSPNAVLQTLYKLFEIKEIKEKTYILIDEYDHFTNELIAFRLEEFKETVSRNGYVRKFFETIKEGTGLGIVDRMFATGVSPITLDSLTSGFNIGKNITGNIQFAEMMGFTEAEVLGLLEKLPSEGSLQSVEYLPELERWYNGYRFNIKSERSIYNPGMILFFCTEYLSNNGFPPEMLDVNVASDYGKTRRLFQLGDVEGNYKVLRELLETKTVGARLTQLFSFEKKFTRDDFISLLYYLGHLTLGPSMPAFPEFKIPNFLIERLFFDYYFNLLEERDKVPLDTGELRNAIIEMSMRGRPEAFFEYIGNILTSLSNRDYQNFTEKHLKVIIMATAVQQDIYYVKSERERTTGYTDIQFLQRPPFPVHSQYLFELKYLQKDKAKLLQETQEETKKQLLAYLEEDAELFESTNLQCWTVVVVKDKLNTERVN